MGAISLIFILIGVAIFFYLFRSGQTTTPVAIEHQAPVPEGGITAIEYFWRPG